MSNVRLEQFYRYSPIIAIVLGFVLQLIVIWTSIWPFTLVAAMIAGLICTELKWGAIAGSLGVLLAWIDAFLFSINNIILQTDQLGILFTGSSGSGFFIVLLIYTIGVVLGLLGGIIGSGIRILLVPVLFNQEKL